MLLIPLFLVAIAIFTLSCVFFFVRRSKGYMASNMSFLIGAGLSILLFLASNLFMYNNWHSMRMIENTYILYIIVLIVPGILGIAGVFIPARTRFLNVLGFAFAFSAIVSGILSVPYLFLFP